ncbi:MAG: ABC transporter permease [Chloroflexia bacterium]|nr:ABC transporter permease [Chloroflexia bacterium]
MGGNPFWRLVPILTLTVRQFLGGKAVRVVVALSIIPCIFAAIYLLNTDVATPREALVDLFSTVLVAPTLLPIIALILATAALGNEVEDRTLPYLVLKPISRFRIVVEKYAAVLIVTVPAVLLGLGLTALIVAQADVSARSVDAERLMPVVWAMLGAATAGIALTAAIFLAVSLVVPRALLAGIVYTFIWESLLGRFLPGLRVISIRHYVQSIFVELLDDPRVTIANVTSLRNALITILVACLVALLLATWRLRRMNLE